MTTGGILALESGVARSAPDLARRGHVSARPSGPTGLPGHCRDPVTGVLSGASECARTAARWLLTCALRHDDATRANAAERGPDTCCCSSASRPWPCTRSSIRRLVADRDGEWIARHGLRASIPSATRSRAAMVEPRWLFCVLVYGVFRAAAERPYPGQLGFGASWAYCPALRMRTRQSGAAGHARRLVPRARGGRRAARRSPRLVSFVALCALLLCLQALPRRRPRALARSLPFVQLVWSNAHGCGSWGRSCSGSSWSPSWGEARCGFATGLHRPRAAAPPGARDARGNARGGADA